MALTAQLLRERLHSLSLEHEEALNRSLVLQGRMMELCRLLAETVPSNGRPVAEENAQTPGVS